MSLRETRHGGGEVGGLRTGEGEKATQETRRGLTRERTPGSGGLSLSLTLLKTIAPLLMLFFLSF